MTTTYCSDDDVQARLELDDMEFKNAKEDLSIDRWRVAAFRKIAQEFRRYGASPPTVADVAAAANTDTIKSLVEGEADIAAGLFRENRIELLEDARPDRDKSWIWKRRGMRDFVAPVVRILHPTSRVRATKEPVDD